ncbi:MAG: peroxidase [Actinobacteria bacterium]|nr:peroxidase [Actinomycetota bacterium]
MTARRPARRGLVRRRGVRAVVAASAVVLMSISTASAGGVAAGRLDPKAGRSSNERTLFDIVFPRGVANLDGVGNNRDHPRWGRAYRAYSRVAEASYADGVRELVQGPRPRYVSNRIFNDVGQNLFSENGVTQWGFAWGQFLDHTIGLRAIGTKGGSITFDPEDPLERFANDLGTIDFARTPRAPGTGIRSPREQMNTVSSYIDAWAVYGGTAERLEWLRAGRFDGDPSNGRARLLMSSDGYLPRAGARGDPSAAPAMELVGRLYATPELAVVAGDVRANENIALTSLHTLFVREHNRLVEALPDRLSAELKFQMARRVVMAEIQHITYSEFLPALGVELAAYRGYRPNVDATLSNEFAVVGYRAHSMVHGEFEPQGDLADYTPEQLDAIRAQGVDVLVAGDEVEFVVPLNVAFGNPDLVEGIGLDAILLGLGAERQYRNDEMIDDQLRSVLFQLPGPDVPDPSDCLDGPPLPECFQTVLDLGAIDIKRGRDHGIPTYNELRVAYGLEPKASFSEVTGEETEEIPLDPLIDPEDPIDDPDILSFVRLLDAEGNELTIGSPEADEQAVVGIRRTTLAARLKAIYGTVDRIDAFVGMLSEPHLPGSELGELQAAIWREQFRRLRDGDRFFYLNDPSLRIIRQRFGIGARRTLAEIILANTDIEGGELPANVFKPADLPPDPDLG